MTFARRVFLIAGALGLLAILPVYFLESAVGRAQPPAITHPEFFYGFLGVTASWQAAFLVIARDPARFRPLMIPAILEKATYGIAVVVLTLIGRIPPAVLLTGLIDLILGGLFILAYLRTTPDREPQR